MKNLLLASGLLLALTPGLSASEDHHVWIADFDEAVAIANDTGKDLFVDFTGSDWCGWCIKLHAEVFDHDEFLDTVSEQYVLVALDYPNTEEVKAKVPNPERNAELAAQYSIRGYPTCLLMTADGVVFGRTGYQAGGPVKYVESLTTLRAEGKRALIELAALEEALAAASEMDMLPVLGKAVAMLADMNSESLGVSKVAAMARTAIAKDADNKTGLKLKAIEALLSAGQADDEINAEARKLDSNNKLGLLEMVVQAQFGQVRDGETAAAAVAAIENLLTMEVLHDKGLVGSLLGQAAMWCEGPLEDHEHALTLAKSALQFRDELPEGLAEALDELAG